METIKVEPHENVVVLRLHQGVTNALDTPLVRALLQEVNQVKEQKKTLVLAGGSKFFSIGFNLPILLKLDREKLREYLELFNECCLTILTLPSPTICAIRGHAIAGGTILALMTDYRLIAPGRKLMGLNEIHLGLPVPYLPHIVLRDLVGERNAAEIVYQGQLIEPETSQKLGLVDAIVSEDKLEEQAIKKADEIQKLPRLAYAAIKRIHQETIIERYQRNAPEKVEEFLDCLFQNETQVLLKKASEKF